MKWKIFAPFAIAILFCACMKVQLFEKNVVIPKQQWDYAFKPSVQFNIEDTTAGYDLYVVVRHTDAYNYNNIWMNLYIQAPGEAAGEGGVGLENIRQRLEQLYGGAQSLVLVEAPDGGTVAQIVVPFRTRAELRTTVVNEGAKR